MVEAARSWASYQRFAYSPKVSLPSDGSGQPPPRSLLSATAAARRTSPSSLAMPSVSIYVLLPHELMAHAGSPRNSKANSTLRRRSRERTDHGHTKGAEIIRAGLLAVSSTLCLRPAEFVQAAR